MENKVSKTNQTENQALKVKPTKARKVRGPRAKTPKVTEVQPTLEFAEPEKDGFRYTQGNTARFAIGSSRHHGTEFALYSRTPAMDRFKLIAKFDTWAKAHAAAERVDADGNSSLSMISSNAN